MRAFNFTEAQIERIKEVCETNEISISQLAREFDLPSRSPIKTIIKNLGLEKSQARSPRMGVKIEWTKEMEQRVIEGYASELITTEELAMELGMSSDSVTKKAKELNLTKVRKNKYADSKVDIIRMISEEGMSRTEVCKHFNMSEQTLRKILKSVDIASGITRISDLEDQEAFFKDLGNPRYSAPDLSRKYGVSDATIHQWRRRIYGEFKLQLNTTQRLSDIEVIIADILEELDVLYVPQKKINQWTVDFYLGRKQVIEVDGIYHDTERVQEKDQRKLADLASCGYEVLSIHHTEFTDLNAIKQKIIRKFGLPAIAR